LLQNLNLTVGRGLNSGSNFGSPYSSRQCHGEAKLEVTGLKSVRMGMYKAILRTSDSAFAAKKGIFKKSEPPDMDSIYMFFK
jgi:hypothetical protein